MNRTQQIAALVFGSALAVAGFYFLNLEMGKPSPSRHFVNLFAGMIGAGALIIFPSIVMEFIKNARYLVPWSGKYGNRTEDIPIQQAPAGTPPGAPVPGAVVPAVVVDPPPTLDQGEK